MAVITTVLTSDLQKPVEVIALKGVFFTGDANANVIAVDVYDGESPATLSGSVKGYVILPDHSTLPEISGTLAGNRASITLPADAYVLEGTIDIVVKLITGSGTSAVKTALGACHGYVARTTTSTAYDPGSVVPSIEDLEYWIEQCQVASGAANTAATKLNNMDATATSLAADATPTATVSTVSGHYRLNFGIPVGVPPDFSIGTVRSGATAAVTMTGTATDPVLNFVLPKGDKGDTGNTGAAGQTGATPAFTIGTVIKGDNASATITGTTANPVLNLVLPKGDPGAAGTPGATGATPAFTVGTITTGAAGSSVTVTITGTNSNPVLNMSIPQGAKGDPGDVSSVNGVSPDAQGNITLTMADISTGTVPINKGGTNATTAANALTNLGAVAKAGDTMTGDLEIATSSSPGVYLSKSGDAFSVTALLANVSTSQALVRSRNRTNPNAASVYENFYFPQPDASRTSSATFYVLTDKTAVTVAQGGTGAATAADARTNLEITPENIGAAKAASVGSNPNANDFTTPGMYYLGTTATNIPAGTNGYLFVAANSNGSSVKQIFSRMGTIGTNDYQTYIRTLTSGTWGSWYAIITEKGGTITGELSVGSNNWNGIYLPGGSSAPQVKISNTGSRLLIDQFSSHSASYGERYRMPPVTAVSGDVYYDVLTTKPGAGYVYGSGDTFSTLDMMPCTGYVTGSSKRIYFSVPVDKSMGNISSIAVNALSGTIRTPAGEYIGGSSSSVNWLTGNTVTAIKVSQYVVRILISFETAPTNAVNNTPVSGTLNVTLEFS